MSVKFSGGENRRGQALMFTLMSATLIFGMTALAIDFGVVYSTQIALDASTRAATLAGAAAMAEAGATSGTVTTAVQNYSSQTGGANASPLLSGATIATGYPALSCMSTVQTMFAVSCYGPNSTNAIAVKQQVDVPLYFLRIFGANQFTLSSLATASMRGASTAPYNVAIVVDTTASMKSTDYDSNCNTTRLNCALSGVQVLLKHLSPCAWTLTSCGTVTNGNVATSYDRVSLFAFPPVTTATVASDYTCSGSVTTAAYAATFPSTSTYQIVDYSSDYRSSDTAASLSTSSHLVTAVAGTSGTPCLKARGGYGTYLAQAITMAQATLVTAQAAHSGSQNVMILLSDGDASASSSDMPGASTTSGTYMSSKNECQQAVTAAAAAATAGTRVYSVAYGASSSGCSTDTSGITPCQTMQRIASSSGYFFSDYTATGGSSSCISSSQPTTSLSQIFNVIAGDLTVSRLIPNNTQ
ncbi:MAG: VWA domain-containing protein [Acidobacteriota bacterium]|nr:VWA domain-containing protein [Acidobacteriota bacterium]